MLFKSWSSFPFIALIITLFSACDSGEIRVASELGSVGSVVISGEAGREVEPEPVVVVRDQRGKSLSGVLVSWTVIGDGSSIGVDTVRSDAQGRAKPGGWKLGIRAGINQLSASVDGLQTVTFIAHVGPSQPYQLAHVSTNSQSAVVGTMLAEAPAVAVLDEWGNRVPQVTVDFSVINGGGEIPSVNTVQSDTNGVARLAYWRLGTSTSVPNVLVARSGSIVSPEFTARAIADSAVRLEAVSVQQQDGVPGLAVSFRPAVRALDRYGNPAGGLALLFSPSEGSGTVTGSARVTDTLDGVARVGSWVLSAAMHQSLTVRSSDLPSDTLVFHARAVSSLFWIDTRFINGEPSTRNLKAVEKAVERWRRVIAGQLEPARVISNESECGPGVPAIDEIITNIRIYVNLDSIDGPGSILGRAGPCMIRTVSGLPVVGYVELDTADLLSLDSTGVLDDVMTHEFGHVLGLQSFNWSRRGLVSNIGEADPFYQGAVGRDQFAMIGGASYSGVPVPLEDKGGAGTRDSHWRQSILLRELMVGYVQSGGMPLSRLSVGSLADLGYQVRLDQAEQFMLPKFGTREFGAMMMSSPVVHYGDDFWPSSIWEVAPDGSRKLLRSGDWRITRQ